VNIQQLMTQFPNGLHDAELVRFEMDYVTRTLRIDLNVSIAHMSDTESRERYHSVRLNFEQVAFLVIESPDAAYPWPDKGTLRIDAGEGYPKPCSTRIPEPPTGSFLVWFYVSDMNSFFLFSSSNVSIERNE
jgi:hypothetical protein